MLGDSHTANGEWERLLARRDVVNEGKAGFTTSHFVMMLPRSVIERNPKTCFVEGGGNDISVGIPITRTVSNIESIIDTLKDHNIIPVLTLSLYTNQDSLANNKADTLNGILKQIANKKCIQCIDLNKDFSIAHFLKREYSKEDGKHLTQNAYPLWANDVKKIIAEYKL